MTLTPAEQERIADTETQSMVAYDLCLRGREIILGKTKNLAVFEEAKGYYHKALEIDPNYSVAYAGLGFAYTFDYQNRWTADPDASLAEAKKYADLAVQNGPGEPLAHLVAGLVAIFEKDIDRARAEVDAALKLNPNMSLAYNLLGNTLKSFRAAVGGDSDD